MLPTTFVVVSTSIFMVTALNSLQGPGGLANPKLFLPMGFKPVSQSAKPHFCSVKFFTALVLPEPPVHANFDTIGITNMPTFSGTNMDPSDPTNSNAPTMQPNGTNPGLATMSNPANAGVDGMSSQWSDNHNQTSSKTKKKSSNAAQPNVSWSNVAPPDQTTSSGSAPGFTKAPKPVKDVQPKSTKAKSGKASSGQQSKKSQQQKSKKTDKQNSDHQSSSKSKSKSKSKPKSKTHKRRIVQSADDDFLWDV